MMPCYLRWTFFLAVCLLFPVGPLQADDTEHRDFSIFIDGKDSGISKMTITKKDDGTQYMTATVDVKFRHLIFAEYVIKVETQEWWKDGRLIGMATKTNDNGKKNDLTAAVDGMLLKLTVNGLTRTINTDCWPNSYWKLADARFHNKQIPILDADSGREFTCELKYLETKPFKIGTQMQDCYHFRVSSAPGPVDLWFDRYHRLVRQEFTESGHRTVVQLINIRR